MPSWTVSCRSSSARRSPSIWRRARTAPAHGRATWKSVSPWHARPGIRTRSSCPARRSAAGRSRRGLPLWEEDTYRRVVRLAWSDTARVYPFGVGSSPRPHPRALWVELILQREFAGGEARAAEEFDLVDSTRDFRLEAVVRPRRARVVLNLVRGATGT